MASISIDALVVGAERLFARGVMTEDELKARKKQLDTTPHLKRDFLIIMLALVGYATATAAWNEGLGPAAWAFAICCMCPATYRQLFGPALNGERSEKEASPAASSLVWSKRDDGSVALIGVPLNVDGTRGEAPQDAEEWISVAFCLCAALGVEIGIAAWTLGVARTCNAIIVVCCITKLVVKADRSQAVAALTPSAGDEATRAEAPEVPPTPPTHQELEDRPPSSDDEFSSESDLEEGQDYVPPPPLPPWPRGASTKTQTPRRHKALDKLRLGHEITSFEVVRALLGNDLLRAVPTDIKRTMEYSGSEIRVVGLLWRGGGDEEEVDEDDPLKPDEWLPREVLAYPPLLELPREQIMRIKHKLDAQARSDAIELGREYPEPDEDSEVLEKLRAARPPEIVRKKHPEFDTEFDPVKVVRQAELDRLEKVSREYREKERFLRPSHVKEDVVEAIQRVAAPRKSHNKPSRPPPPRPLNKEYPFRIGPPAFSRTQAMHEDMSKRPAPSGDPADGWIQELYGDDEVRDASRIRGQHVHRRAAAADPQISRQLRGVGAVLARRVEYCGQAPHPAVLDLILRFYALVSGAVLIDCGDVAWYAASLACRYS